ncbi:Bug family tripartite tricarboxylate transporter substrate binding protein [Curvibacter microcysteis]|uniref:Bug family tripartite tricarboxylate transporter substrate binding protein n=1 Tax=Curvibacter microcysteis TaxID=3026419 RepID=UPI0039081B5D
MNFTQFSRRAVLRQAGPLLGLCLALGTAHATTFPDKPVRLVVPFPAGGGTDIIARAVGQHLSETQKWTVVVDNKPGAGGNLGVDAVAKAPADGYTLVLGQTSNLAINPTLYAKLPYAPLKDLKPVVLAATAPLVIVVPVDSKLTSLEELLNAARKAPDRLVFGTPGNGTVAHLAAEQMQKAAGVRMQHVPYKGSAQALTDLMGGQIDAYVSSVPTALSHLKGGRMRALAVTSLKRSTQLPQVPTVAESGLKGFEANTWFGFLAPAGTPAPVLDSLNKAINLALKAPSVRERLMGEGGEVLGGSQAEFTALLKTDLQRWGQIVRDAGARID